MNEAFLDYLVNNHLTEARKNKIFDVSSNKTEHITVVLDRLKDPKDISAIIRTCECFSINSIHIIENKEKYLVNKKVSRGSFKWIKIIKYNEIRKSEQVDCITYLKEKGYKIVHFLEKNLSVTNFNIPITSMDDLDLKQKIALVFSDNNNEIENFIPSDELVFIKKINDNFDFNISLNVSIILHNLVYLLNKQKIAFKLTPEELLDLRLDWLKTELVAYNIYQERFFASYTSNKI
ncbi:MAG: TrmH family RNA methyltransferase [Candidatus Sericytochromatia bacterium]